jgi:serine/threonine protein kinase
MSVCCCPNTRANAGHKVIQMTSWWPHGDVADEFFRGLIRASARQLAHCLIPGSEIVEFIYDYVGDACCRAALEWLKQRSARQCEQAIDGLTQMRFDTARAIAEAELDKLRLQISPEVKAKLLNYVSYFPMTFKNRIRRYDDRDIATTLLSQIPRTYEDMMRFMPLRPPRFEPGYQVPDHDYSLVALLGQGGFGEVWKAHNILRTGQPPVVLKFCFDSKLVVSLKREIELLDRLAGHLHPEDFVRLHETAYSADAPFLVYEYVDGSNLDGWLAGFGGKQPPVEDVVRILRMTARAMAFAHRQGIVHRDLKPANLLVTREGRIKVCDFGIGTVIAGAEAQCGIGKVVMSATTRSVLSSASTPLYADPSQRSGELPDPKDDIYAIGVIAYQLLSASVTKPIYPAWRGELEETNIRPDLLDVIGACVDVRSKRLANGGELLAALDDLDRKELPRRGVWKRGLQRRNHPPMNSDIAVRHCTQCGTNVQPGDTFCTRCGYRII